MNNDSSIISNSFHEDEKDKKLREKEDELRKMQEILQKMQMQMKNQVVEPQIENHV